MNSARRETSIYKPQTHHWVPWFLVLAFFHVGGAGALHAQERPLEEHCAAAASFLMESSGMRAITEPDTIQDWRTQQEVPGCRTTAAGLTPEDEATEARLFYERLRDAGWTRTPDPRDSPNEASLRFRMDSSDCLFNFYPGGLLETAADLEVTSEMIPGPGETRYNIFVMCTPAMDATPRQQSTVPLRTLRRA